MNKTIDIALSYIHDCKFSILPVKNKTPLAKWTEYQNRFPTDDEVREWFIKNPNAGIGIITGAISNLCVIDIDDMDIGLKAIYKIIGKVNCPISITQKGGLHLFFRPGISRLENNARKIDGADFRGEGGFIVAPPSLGEKGPYKWKEGRSVFTIPIPDLPETYIEAVKSLSKGKKAVAPTGDEKLFSAGQRDHNLFSVANSLIKGGASPELATETLTRLISSWGENDPKWATDKIESALKRAGRKDGQVEEEVRHFLATATGIFTVNEIYTALAVSYKEEKTTVRAVLDKLCKEEFIAPEGKKNGHYRKIDKEYEVLSTEGIDPVPLPIIMPLDIHKLVELYPTNVVVLAGVTNAGKTTFLLDLALMNKDRFKIRFYNTEMDNLEFKKKQMDFERNGRAKAEDWQGMTFIRRTEAIEDILNDEPGLLHILDYMDVTSDFTGVPDKIDKIHKKLKHSVIFIALQKKDDTAVSKTDWGFGGQGTASRSRLYISMGKSEVKIVKGKNHASHLNPNGMTRQYTIFRGCKIQPMGGWKNFLGDTIDINCAPPKESYWQKEEEKGNDFWTE